MGFCVTRFFNLLWALVLRDLRTRYRRSVLGPLWAIIQPLALMIMFTVIRNFIKISSDGLPYVLFSYTALIPWQFFSSAITRSGPSIMTNASILKKIALPREVFPLAELITALFDMLISGAILAGMMLYYRVQMSWSLLWLPLLVLLLGVLAFAVSLFISALGTFKSDFLLAAPFLLQVWLYATPIIYPLSSVPERWRSLYQLNPTVGLIEGFRSVLLRSSSPDLGLVGISALGSLLALAVAWPLFRRMSQYFADVL